MKQLSLFIILFILFLTPLLLFSKEKILIEKQTIQIEIQPEKHLAKIQVDLQFSAPEKTEDVAFLINENVDNLSISHLSKELNYTFDPDFKRSVEITEPLTLELKDHVIELIADEL